MVLYITDKLNCTLNATVFPNTNNSKCFEMLKANKETNKLVILIHGFLNGFKTQWLHDMKDAIQRAESNAAVIVSNILFTNNNQLFVDIFFNCRLSVGAEE